MDAKHPTGVQPPEPHQAVDLPQDEWPETPLPSLNPPIDYRTANYPRTGCTLTVTALPYGFEVLVRAPGGLYIESWRYESARQLGLGVACWAAGKSPAP